MKRPYYVIYEWGAEGKAKAYRYVSPNTRTKETLSPAQAGRLKNFTDLTKGDTLPAQIAGKDFGEDDELKKAQFDAFGEKWPASLKGLRFNSIGWNDIDKITQALIHEACKKESPAPWVQDLWDNNLHPEYYMDSGWDDLMVRCIHDVERATNTRWGHTSNGDYGWGIFTAYAMYLHEFM